jgi:hypothetical protein
MFGGVIASPRAIWRAVATCSDCGQSAPASERTVSAALPSRAGSNTVGLKDRVQASAVSFKPRPHTQHPQLRIHRPKAAGQNKAPHPEDGMEWWAAQRLPTQRNAADELFF